MQTLKKVLNIDKLPDGALTVKEGIQDVEIDLQTMALTFKAAHLRALPSEIANSDDVFQVFGHLFADNKNLLITMQCAVVEDATNRMWVRLVGQDHDVQFWKSSDPRFPIPDDTLRFFPDDLVPTEDWVYPLFEPVRRAYFERSFWLPPIFILLPDRVTVLSDTAIRGKDLDEEKANEARLAAQEAIKNAASELDLAKATSELAVMAAQLQALRKFRRNK